MLPNKHWLPKINATTEHIWLNQTHSQAVAKEAEALAMEVAMTPMR